MSMKVPAALAAAAAPRTASTAAAAASLTAPAALAARAAMFSGMLLDRVVAGLLLPPCSPATFATFCTTVYEALQLWLHAGNLWCDYSQAQQETTYYSMTQETH